MKQLLYITVLLFSVIGMAQNEALFNQGKDNYKAEKYSEAITNWKQIVDKGNHSAELYFNLGNAYYKLNQIGPSIYYYEKAQQLAPNDKEIKVNLAFAENAKVDVIEPLPKTVFSKWYNNIASVFTYEGWATATVVFSMLFVGFFLLYYFNISEGKKRLFFTSAIVCVFLLIGGLSMAYLTFADVQNNKPAIVFAESVEIKTAPKMNSAAAFTLHEGTKVQVLDSDGDWLRISLADGKDGWIPKTDLKLL
ncbi:BatE protein [Patiriisocius marinistellae]|uniref:BatE protein n=1 Tax=Patiriisocius marinistellae TaxID=2494560 RepID=A0A5J4FV93_9FLAO|nr:tetratricopeptide repeat protein [Patiriisocius marinistellae]GEQ84994.1 BatE protein [Patiriisocius marinistellae]